MNWFLWGTLIWLGFSVLKLLYRRAQLAADAPEEMPASTPVHRYGFDERRNGLLALAHPVAAHRIPVGFADASHDASPIAQDALKTLRAPLLHQFGLRNDASDEQVRAQLTARLKNEWFGIDLSHLHEADHPRDALAFACARLAFSVRAASLLGLIDDSLAWQVLSDNGLRAGDCFVSWEDYGLAWARGRRQWIERSRADSLGISFGESEVLRWTRDADHPWGQWPWGVLTLSS